MTHNIATAGDCSINMACVSSCLSEPLPSQLWNTLNITLACLLFVFLTTSGFCPSRCAPGPSAVLTLLFSLCTWAPRHLVVHWCPPSRSIRDPSPSALTECPCQGRSVPGSLAVCAFAEAPTVWSIAGVHPLFLQCPRQNCACRAISYIAYTICLFSCSWTIAGGQGRSKSQIPQPRY